MQYSILGKSGLEISRIGFGAMSLQMASPGNAELLHQAIAEGVNFFDTADLYDRGLNEEVIGKALKEKRKEVVVATKVGNQWRPDGSGWDWNPNPDYILECVDKSLKRLQTDYIDLYQLHGGTLEDPIDEVIATFEKLKTEGKIRCYGISSIRPNVIREYVKRSSIVSVMTQYSLLDRRPEESTLQLLHEHNIGVLVRGSLAQGLLVDKPAREYLGQSAKAVEKAAAVVKSISQRRNAAQSAIQYILHHPAVTAAVVGIRTIEQLKEAVATMNVEKLSDQEYLVLQQSVPANFYDLHR
jgi:aryl-alcohol dehydrogenase-like predicted oxidoreductase